MKCVTTEMKKVHPRVMDLKSVRQAALVAVERKKPYVVVTVKKNWLSQTKANITTVNGEQFITIEGVDLEGVIVRQSDGIYSIRYPAQDLLDFLSNQVDFTNLNL